MYNYANFGNHTEQVTYIVIIIKSILRIIDLNIVTSNQVKFALIKYNNGTVTIIAFAIQAFWDDISGGHEFYWQHS